MFSYATNQWTPFLNSTETKWVFSDAINGLDKSVSVSNKLELKKAGDQISIYVNEKLLFTQKISETGRPLNNFEGVGITQKGMVKGQLSGVKFQVLSE
jgi:hypothetical protein